MLLINSKAVLFSRRRTHLGFFWISILQCIPRNSSSSKCANRFPRIHGYSSNFFKVSVGSVGITPKTLKSYLNPSVPRWVNVQRRCLTSCEQALYLSQVLDKQLVMSRQLFRDAYPWKVNRVVVLHLNHQLESRAQILADPLCFQSGIQA